MTARNGTQADAMHSTIAIIGGGQMALALVEGFCSKGLLRADAITLYDPSPAARERLTSRVPGLLWAATAREAAEAAGIVWLAVKPQQAAAAAGAIKGAMAGRTLVSIVAGLATASLASLAGTPQVIRVMPNTPCLVGRGVSVVCQTAAVPATDSEWVRSLLSAVGHVHQVDESLMNAVTGLSGSGPGFLALVVEALTAGGVEAGLPKPLAEALAVQTLAGTGSLLEQTGEDPAVIRGRVSSQGGTTLAGLAVLEARGIPRGLADAVIAAAARAGELGS